MNPRRLNLGASKICGVKVIVSVLLAVNGIYQLAFAHDPGLSTATVTIEHNFCWASLVFSKVDAAILLKTFTSNDEVLDAEHIAAGLRPFAENSLELESGGRIQKAKFIRTSADKAGNVTVRLGFDRSVSSRVTIRSKWLDLLPPGHRQFLSVALQNRGVFAERMLSSNSSSAPFDFAGQTSGSNSTNRGSFIGFVSMGVTHIWTGYDHLLFLFALLAVTRNLRGVFKIVTCFTIAHSVTLALAALNIFTLPSRLVEPMIAASIVFVSVENLLRHGKPKGRCPVTIAFGLIHGFGFASALRELGVAESGRGVAMPLLSFNLGVELGQLTIAAVALPLIWKLRDQPVLARRWIPVTSVIIGVLGFYWFAERIVG